MVVAVGVGIVIMAVLVRAAIASPEGRITNTLAIVVGLVLVVAGLVAVRIDVARAKRRSDDPWSDQH